MPSTSVGPARRGAAGFVFARLVDHMHTVVVPIVLGRGVRLWDGLEGLERATRSVTAPTLVVDGSVDPVFPHGHGHGLALANEIPGAQVLTLERTGHELPSLGWDIVIPAILRHTGAG
jgi:pimeloyl-ACP methyl ester carboxylesterase